MSDVTGEAAADSTRRAISTAKPPAIRITARISERRPVDEKLVLPFELRSRSRFRAVLGSGRECGVVLARGDILREGELLISCDGRVVEVKAAPEMVSTVRSEDARLLTLTAYHLGNRHVALQIGAGWLRYLHDHVLDDMVSGLGAEVFIEHSPFEPEAGPYRADAHARRHHGFRPGDEHDPSEAP